MSWFQKLYETYEACVKNPDFVFPPGEDKTGLMPLSHISQQAHIHIILDEQANFLDAELFPPKKQVVLPATEGSAGRARDYVPHPLADKIHYCAKDYAGTKDNLYELYEKQLAAWCASPHTHPKAQAVYSYTRRGSLVKDLLRKGILHADASGNLLTKAPDNNEDSIFKRLTAKQGIIDQGDALVLWSVQARDDLEPRTWQDKSLQESWIAYYDTCLQDKALCMLTGQEVVITKKHPRNIRRPGDGAKLISSNDNSGFTFRGHFLAAEEGCTVGYYASQKVHNALRWLIARQSYRSGDQAILAWVTNGANVPNPADWQLDEYEDFSIQDNDKTTSQALIEGEESVHLDVGQSFSNRLRKAIHGYKVDLKDTDGISVLALDSAGPGRIAVTFYREQSPEDYLKNLEKWQEDTSWLLPIRKDEKDSKVKSKTVFGAQAPLPRDIAQVAYGKRIDDKLLKATIERLLPCIVDGAPIPRDLVESCVRRACNRPGLEKWEWFGVLGTACGIYKGFYARHPQPEKRREYHMVLDTERHTRDYLYGRLLAVAEYIERSALNMAGEKRPTNAERLMQRFADSPCSTWKNLEIHLAPYKQRLQSREDGLWIYDRTKRVLQEICNAAEDIDDFVSPGKLGGEFLLGYHCQYSDFFKKSKKDHQDISENQQGEDK